MNLEKKNQDCSENQNDHGEKKGLMKHGFMMMLCCLIPIVLIAGLPLFGAKAGGGLSSLIFLLCPLMHIGMIFMMRKSGKGGSSCHSSSSDVKVEDSKQKI